MAKERVFRKNVETLREAGRQVLNENKVMAENFNNLMRVVGAILREHGGRLVLTEEQLNWFTFGKHGVDLRPNVEEKTLTVQLMERVHGMDGAMLDVGTGAPELIGHICQVHKRLLPPGVACMQCTNEIRKHDGLPPLEQVLAEATAKGLLPGSERCECSHTKDRHIAGEGACKEVHVRVPEDAKPGKVEQIMSSPCICTGFKLAPKPEPEAADAVASNG